VAAEVVTSSPDAGVAFAPIPPGRIGEAAEPAELLAYLADLSAWVDQRRRELDRLDAAALDAQDAHRYTGDVLLSMALWQSVRDRQQEVERVWDDGRADRSAREQISRLVFGRLDAAAGAGSGGGVEGLSVSLAEACRLSDALAAQLRSRLSFDPRAAQDAERVRELRAALERLRELARQEPDWDPQVGLLATRLDDVATRAARGGDVRGPLEALETDAARAERDLIVATASKLRAERRQDRDRAELLADRVRAAHEVAALEHREEGVRAAADRCVREIAGAPRLAVPDPQALGPVPADRPQLDAFLARLGAVVRAMDVAEAAYAGPLAERDELAARLDGYRVMAARSGRSTEPRVGAAADAALAAVRTVPCDVAIARTAVRRYQDLVRAPAEATTEPGATP
jgi:hypothetical protein